MDEPEVAGKFHKEFADKVKLDHDMAERGIKGYSAMVATFGSLSHSHLNCCMRNILCGKRGCECNSNSKGCECNSRPIVDSN